MPRSPLAILQDEIISCEVCPRLVEYRQHVALEKKRAYRDCEYWGKPVPSFGDPQAQVLVIGLAPAAHGANRTGRMFTGDRSGDYLFQALHETGFASQLHSQSRDDGLVLRNLYISAAVRCAPPGNKPSPLEFRNCRGYLEREIALLPRLRVVVALGRIAFDAYLGILGVRRSSFVFAHNRLHGMGAGKPVLISSYHPSQQNTSTGLLTHEMLRDVFELTRNAALP